MRKTKVFLCVVLVLGLVGRWAYVQGEEEKQGLQMNGMAGATVLTDPETGEAKVYYKLNMQPELALGKFGMGLDIDLYFNEEGSIRTEDWKWENLPGKIMYVRWGHKREPLFIWFGGLKSVTLGHGLIMDRYTNMLSYPDEKTKGLEVDVNMKYFGVETMVNDINFAKIFGGRVYVKPLAGLSLPVLPKLALGVSAATDINPDDNKTGDTEDEVRVYGGDLELPIFENPKFSAIAYGEMAKLDVGKYCEDRGVNDGGSGAAVGLMGKIVVVNWRAEYRRSQANFIPGYFDSYYDVTREKRWQSLIGKHREDITEGPYAEASFSVLNKVSALLSFETSNKKYVVDTLPDGTPIYDKPHIHLKVSAPKLIQKVGIEFDYDKRNVRKFKDVYETEGPNTIIETRLNYWVAPNVSMVIIYRQKYDKFGELRKSTSMETKISF